MAEKIETVASTDKADRLKAMAQVTMKRVRDFGLPGFVPREPEYAKLEDALKKNKKPVNFTIRFENAAFRVAGRGRTRGGMSSNGSRSRGAADWRHRGDR